MSRKVVFDFDKTLTYKDTILDFFIHAASKNLLFPFKLFFYCFSMVLVKCHVINTFTLKKWGVSFFLKGLSREQLDEKCRTYSEVIKLNYIYNNDFKSFLKEEKTEVIIVSASFIEYLGFVFPNERVIGSTMMYIDNRVSGLKYECIGKHKVIALSKIGWNAIDIFYTDSISDAPVAQIATDIYLVNKDSKQHCLDYNDFVRKCSHL